MTEEPRPGVLDRLVDLLARGMDAVGLNGTRLRWKWNRKRSAMSEAAAQREVMLRSAKGRHKMCPSCRALVSRSAASCPDCGTSLTAVRAPGPGRLLTNLFPGVSAATSLLLLVNGFWFIMMLMAQLKSGSGSGGLLSSFGPEMLVQFGSGLSRVRELSSGVLTGGEWWRLVTPIFLHGGLLHFAFNSYVLLQLGPIVEEIYGTERFWVFYLACGLAGSATSQLPRFVNTVGASGAIMGLMGLLLVYGWRRGGGFGDAIKRSMLRFGMYMIILSFFFPNIDHLNHAGGFACGALAAWLFPERRGRAESPAWQVLSFAGVGLVLFAFFKVAMFAKAAG